MGPTDPKHREVVRSVSRELVAQLEPDELEVFDELIDEYFADPSPPAEQSRGSELGSIQDPATWIATSQAVAAVVSAVIAFLAPILASAYRDHLKDTFEELLPKIFGKEEALDEDILTKAELEELRKIILIEATRWVSRTRAEMITNAVVARLALE